jgi:predicted transcriptional regulator
MIEQYKMSRNKKREAYLVEALAAWSDYQATGLHVTAEEADAWLA